MYRFTKSLEGEDVLVLVEGDKTTLIPMNPDCPEYQDYLAWVDEGNAADPYVEPYEPPLTTEQKVNNLLSDYGLTRDEMRAALSAKSS